MQGATPTPVLGSATACSDAPAAATGAAVVDLPVRSSTGSSSSSSPRQPLSRSGSRRTRGVVVDECRQGFKRPTRRVGHDATRVQNTRNSP